MSEEKVHEKDNYQPDTCVIYGNLYADDGCIVCSKFSALEPNSLECVCGADRHLHATVTLINTWVVVSSSTRNIGVQTEAAAIAEDVGVQIEAAAIAEDVGVQTEAAAIAEGDFEQRDDHEILDLINNLGKKKDSSKQTSLQRSSSSSGCSEKTGTVSDDQMSSRSMCLRCICLHYSFFV
jgi:hypothetical protein